MDIDPPFVVAAAGHPSLDGAVARFCAGLWAEARRCSRSGDGAPAAPLVARLAAAKSGIRLAAVRDGEVIGLAIVDESTPVGGELLVAVAAPWRRQGVAGVLGRAVVARRCASTV